MPSPGSQSRIPNRMTPNKRSQRIMQHELWDTLLLEDPIIHYVQLYCCPQKLCSLIASRLYAAIPQGVGQKVSCSSEHGGNKNLSLLSIPGSQEEKQEVAPSSNSQTTRTVMFSGKQRRSTKSWVSCKSSLACAQCGYLQGHQDTMGGAIPIQALSIPEPTILIM